MGFLKRAFLYVTKKKREKYPAVHHFPGNGNICADGAFH